jgi:hypothetical protein
VVSFSEARFEARRWRIWGFLSAMSTRTTGFEAGATRGSSPVDVPHRYSFAGGGALHRLSKPLDSDGVPPVLGCAGGVSSSLPTESHRHWEGPAAMASVELGDPKGLLCNFLSLGVFLAFVSGQLFCLEVSCSVCICVLCIAVSVI